MYNNGSAAGSAAIGGSGLLAATGAQSVTILVALAAVMIVAGFVLAKVSTQQD